MKEYVHLYWKLFQDTYTFRAKNHSEEFRRLQPSFLLKSWVVHIILMIIRVSKTCLGLTAWQEAYENDDQKIISELDESKVKEFEPYFFVAQIVLLVAGVILDLAIMKKRELAKSLLYFECVCFLLNGYAPYNYGQFKETYIRLMIIGIFVGVACDPAPNILASLITQIIYGFVILPQVWLNELTGA